MFSCDERQWGGPTATRESSGHVRTCGPGQGMNVAMEAQRVEDRDLTKLLKLLKVFPAFSLEAIAQAYTDADSDVNVAAELLATRQPISGSNGVQEAMINSIAEWESDGYSRQTAEHPSDDLLLEKYGRGVGELINRVFESNSLAQSAPDGTSHNAIHWYSSTAYGDDNRNRREEVVNKEGSHGVLGDGMLLGGRKTKQKGRGGLDHEVEVSRQAGEDFLVSMLGENSELGIAVVRDVLDSLEGDTEKSLEVLLQMVPQAHNVDSTFNQDGSYFDDNNLDGRIQSHYQWMEPHMDKAPMQTSMKYQKRPEGTWNGTNLEPEAWSLANGHSHDRSIKDGTNHDYYKVALEELKEWFPNSYEGYLLQVLQNHNFILSDAVQFVLDQNLNECMTPPVSNVDFGNHSRSFKSNVPKQIDSLAIARPPPLKATWADVKRTIVPLKQSSMETASEGKNGLTKFKSHGGVDDYERNRLAAQEHWRLTNYYFKEAAAAYGRGEHCRAATLVEKGKKLKQLAREADGHASQRLFQSRNKKFNNNITIDLHGLHVGEAINVLKRHLQVFCSIPSVNMLTVITGYGSHSTNGLAKIKPAVIGYLSRKGISWEGANEGCLTIKMIDVQNKGLELSAGE